MALMVPLAQQAMLAPPDQQDLKAQQARMVLMVPLAQRDLQAPFLWEQTQKSQLLLAPLLASSSTSCVPQAVPY